MNVYRVGISQGKFLHNIAFLMNHRSGFGNYTGCIQDGLSIEYFNICQASNFFHRHQII